MKQKSLPWASGSAQAMYKQLTKITNFMLERQGSRLLHENFWSEEISNFCSYLYLLSLSYMPISGPET